MQKMRLIILALLVLAPLSVHAGEGNDRVCVEPTFSLLDAALRETARFQRLQTTAGGQSPAELKAIPTGTRVRITLTTGAVLDGRLMEQQPDTLVLRNSELRRGHLDLPTGISVRDRLNLPRSAIASIETLPGRKVPTGVKAAIWVGVGVAAFFVTGYVVCHTGHCL
jgi:hypothetical protein